MDNAASNCSAGIQSWKTVTFTNAKCLLADCAVAGVLVHGSFALDRGQPLASFLSYFTIITTLLVVASVDVRRTNWETTIAVYISIVGAK